VNQIQNQKAQLMKKTRLLSIIGLLAFGLMFGVKLAQAQSIGGQKAGTLDPTSAQVET
jgi:hypothetical protein